MKIVIFGLTISSSWGNGHATLWRGLLRALTQRGHVVEFYERDVPYYAAHRDLTTFEGGELILYSRWEDVILRANRSLADADVGMVTSYCPDGIVASDLVLASAARLKVFYDLDTPVTLDQLRLGRAVAYIGERGLRDFDLVLSYTGGRALDQLRSELGAKRVAPLYGSVDPRVHHRVPVVEQFQSDLSYLGTYAADRQGTLQRLFIDAAQRLPSRKFLIGGAQYPQEFPWASNIYFASHVAPPDHPAFYSSSRMTLNVTRQAMAEMGFCPSGRLFEAAACGTPILSDGWEGLEEFFTPGEEILVAESTEEALRALNESDSELEKIARAARERTMTEHTAEHRAIDLETLMELGEEVQRADACDA